MTPSAAAPCRDSRRTLLLAAASELFLRHPYGAVTVEMVATEAGITAPGLYRHFRSKQALLVAAIEEGLHELHIRARAVADGEPDPRVALEAMIDLHVRSVIDGPPRTLMFARTEHALPESDRRRIRQQMTGYAQEWFLMVVRLRPDLCEPQVRLLTQAVFEMLNSVVTLAWGLDHEEIVATMTTAAVEALAAR